MSDLISRQDAMNAIQKRADEIDSVYSAFWEGLKIAQDIVEKVPSAEPEQKTGRKFLEIVVNYPKVCTYPEYEGKPYYSIKYEENGEMIVGFGTYKPEVLSQYLREYFISPAEAELEEFEWCHDCKEYDQEKHCCHRWTKVIRNTVEEIKTKYWRWIPVTEALPEEEVTVLVSAHYDGDKCYDYKSNDYVTTAEYMDGRWFLSDEEHIMQLHKHHVIAWMQLPEPWREE